jgi:lactoylglutathione lyase
MTPLSRLGCTIRCRRGRLRFEGPYNIYLGLPGGGDTLELTVNEGREEPYDLGTGYGHIALSDPDR